MPGAAKPGYRVRAESPSPTDNHAVSLHYCISFISRSRHPSNVLMKTNAIPGRGAMVLIKLTNGKSKTLREGTHLGSGSCLCQVPARSWAKKDLLKAPEQIAGEDLGLCAPAFGCLCHKIAPSPRLGEETLGEEYCLLNHRASLDFWGVCKEQTFEVLACKYWHSPRSCDTSCSHSWCCDSL